MLSKHLTGKFRAVAAASVAVDKTRRMRALIQARHSEIERLEQTITEQDAKIAGLKAELREAEFKAGVLEQSYATQLEEARSRAAAAEEALEAQHVHVAELESAHQTLTREFGHVKARLDSIFPDDGLTVDELLENFSTSARRSFAEDPDAQVDAPPDPRLLEEMLPVDVMFTRKRK